ncbi:MAG: response regulator transcription factor [Granulosicoccus sp.]
MSTTAQTVAIIDDDPLVRASLSDLLKENGFEPFAFRDSASLLGSSHRRFDIYLVDLRLANESGLDIVREIVMRHNAPVIMLSGFGDEIDKAIGLEAGADDYISKPFNSRELIARVRALLRRCQHHTVDAPHNSNELASSEPSFGGYYLDSPNRRIYNSSHKEISLTNAEFRLLEYMLTNHDRIIDRSELLNYLGGDLSQCVDRTIDVMILRLRGKIEVSPSKPVHLQTRRGRGYIFVLNPQT